MVKIIWFETGRSGECDFLSVAVEVDIVGGTALLGYCEDLLLQFWGDGNLTALHAVVGAFGTDLGDPGPEEFGIAYGEAVVEFLETVGVANLAVFVILGTGFLGLDLGLGIQDGDGIDVGWEVTIQYVSSTRGCHFTFVVYAKGKSLRNLFNFHSC